MKEMSGMNKKVLSSVSAPTEINLEPQGSLPNPQRNCFLSPQLFASHPPVPLMKGRGFLEAEIPFSASGISALWLTLLVS